MTNPMQLRFILVGTIAFGILLLSACAGVPTPTATPVPTPTATPVPTPTATPVPTPTATPVPTPTATPVPTPTPTPVPTPTPTPVPLMDQAQGLVEEVVDTLREALEGVDSLDDLAQMGVDGSEELIGHLCDIAAGQYEPHLALGDLTDSFVVETGIRGYCASR